MGGTNGTQGQDKGDPIFAPLKLRAVTVKNRILRSNIAGRFPEELPAQFYRAYDAFDCVNVGYVSSGAEAEKLGSKFATSVRGNSNKATCMAPSCLPKTL